MGVQDEPPFQGRECELHGMVRSLHSVHPAEVAALAGGAALIIAHDAAFDRRFVEGLSEVFVTKLRTSDGRRPV